MSRRRARLYSRYALFLERFRGRYDLAESFYQRALAIDPTDVESRGRYAIFLELFRREPDRAEAEYQIALALAPAHPVLLGNYADFLEHLRGDLDQAEHYYQIALEAAPRHPNNLVNYATFLVEERGALEQAELLYQRALAIQPDHRNGLFKYALFLTDHREAYGEAERLYRTALAAYPNNGAVMANLIGVLFLSGQMAEGRRLLALTLVHPVFQSPSADRAECWFYRVAHGTEAEHLPSVRALRQLLEAGVRSPGFQLGPHVKIAQAQGHPWSDWLGPLAAVLTEGAELASLDPWPVWNEAQSSPLH